MVGVPASRVVVAKYLEGPWLRSDDDLTWMQYLQERANTSPASDAGADDEAGSTYNPYDYEDPSSHPHDMKDGQPLVQYYDEMGGEYGVTYGPKLYNEEEGILKDWVKARRTDWTADPSEQNPAMSLDRRYATMEVEAATLNEVVNKDFHYTNDRKIERAGSVAVRLSGTEQESMLSGLFEFSCQSQRSNQPRTVTMQFLRPKGRLRPKSYLDYPVQLACTCPSFLFYGAQYYAVTGKYMWMPGFRPSLVPPHHQNMIVRSGHGKGLNFRVCKHVLACYNWIESRGLKILMHYRRYPQVGPPAKVMNAKEWERLVGFPFTLEEVKRRLASRKPVLPRFYYTNFFRNREQNAELAQWFTETWLNRGESEKMRVLETLVEHPEEIFYLLVKDAIEAPTKVSPAGIEKAFDLMSRVVQPDNDQEPKGPRYKQKGTGVVIPGQEMGEKGGPDVKPVKGYEPAYKSVGTGAKDEDEEGDERFNIKSEGKPKRTPDQEKRRQRVRKTLRPYLKRESSEGVVVLRYLDSLEAA